MTRRRTVALGGATLAALLIVVIVVVLVAHRDGRADAPAASTAPATTAAPSTAAPASTVASSTPAPAPTTPPATTATADPATTVTAGTTTAAGPAPTTGGAPTTVRSPATTVRGATTTTDPDATPAFPCEAAGLLKAYAASQPLPAGGATIGEVRCYGIFAGGVLNAPGAGSAFALFGPGPTGWQLLNVGSAFVCQPYEIPDPAYTAIGCPAWDR